MSAHTCYWLHFFFFMWERKNVFAQKSFETVCRKSDVHTMVSSSILSSSGGTEQTEKNTKNRETKKTFSINGGKLCKLCLLKKQNVEESCKWQPDDTAISPVWPNAINLEVVLLF